MLKSLKENLKYIRYYGINSLSIRYFITIFLILMVPLMTISYLVYNNSEQSLNKEIMSANRQSLSSIQQAIDSTLEEIDRLGEQVLANSDIELLAKLEYERLISYDRARMIGTMHSSLSIIAAAYDYMDSIHIYVPNSGYVISPSSGNQVENVDELQWLEGRDLDSIAGKWFIESIEEKDWLVHTVNVKFDKEYSAMVIMIIDIGKLVDNYNDHSNTQNRLMVFDEMDSVLYDNRSSFYKQSYEFVQDQLGYEVQTDESDAFQALDNSGTYVLTSIESRVNDWFYTSVVSMEAYKDLRRSYMTFIILLIVSCVFISISSSLLITFRSVTPINRIMAMIEGKHIDEGSNKKVKGEGINELKYILQAIKETNMERKEMTMELEQRYEALRAAKKIALQSQINPHFLFNSLESLNWKVLKLTMSENEASIMIQQLSKLLEFSLETGSNLISIDEELEHAKLYVEFQKNRYKESFEIVYDIQDEVLEYCCITLIFQPVLENAIYHGIKPDDNKNLITIKAYSLEDEIVFKVRDDGIGIDKDQLDEVNKDLAQDFITEQHIGLANVNQRIKLIFGEKYGLELSSEKGVFSEVKIKIPKVEKENLS